MKILYIASPDHTDYLSDGIFHGLRCRFGADVVDAHRLWHLYRDSFAADPAARARLYGKGFTLYGLLPDLPVDRSDLVPRLRGGDFDLVIYGNIHRCQDYLLTALDHVPAERLLFLDGEDLPDLHRAVIGRGLYFKRELTAALPAVWPVQFSIPAEKLCPVMPAKRQARAFIDPRRRETYRYEREEDYYADYQSSFFAVTTQKAGWDALRHYEIMANRCLPLFPALDQCPVLTLFRLPKYEIELAGRLLGHRDLDGLLSRDGLTCFAELESRLFGHLCRFLTTEAMAGYLLDIQTATRSAGPAVLFGPVIRGAAG